LKATVQVLRNKLEQKKGQRDRIQKELDTLSDQITEVRRDVIRHQEAREIIRKVGLATQQQLQYHISDITSLALGDVFDDPYELQVEFVQRRNKTECDIFFTRDEEKIDPIMASGGGAVDVAAFALRIAAWSMQSPRTRNTIILDEPFKFVDKRTDRLERASEMVKELSDRLGLQFIIVTHEETLASYADKTFNVELRKGVSHVR